MMKQLFLSALFLHSILGSKPAYSRMVQILHTNDTHSFLNNTNHNENVGGSSRLKSLIDYFKMTAKKDGVETITLDGGDFLEGNVYYMADKGLRSLEVHNQIGYDAVVLGNHDYLMGSQGLDEILEKVDLNFALLGANITSSGRYSNVKNKIKPYKELVVDGFKIGIIGLTTSDIIFSWSLEGSKISNPYDAAIRYEKILKDRGNDFIFALTHIGVNRDLKLAKKTKHIDLIVGGHSHTELHTALYEKNKNKVDVPIVQAGHHTKYLGRLVVDIEKGQPLKVLKYELVPVKYEAEDPEIKAMVDEADLKLEEQYGKDYLNEKVGFSDLKGEDKTGSKKWSYYISDALREKTNTDIAIHVFSMNGENYPVGEVTRRDVMNSIPRAFEFNDQYGWNIYTTKISGYLLKLAFESLAYFGQPLSFSGIDLEWIKTPFGPKIASARINGKKINRLKMYKVAFTEGIIRGALEVSSKTKIILRDPKKTPYKIWDTIVEKLKVDSGRKNYRSIASQDDDINHSIYFPE
jgi:5'-nucleotidase/UDP-sugar diphosphatase